MVLVSVSVAAMSMFAGTNDASKMASEMHDDGGAKDRVIVNMYVVGCGFGGDNGIRLCQGWWTV